MTLKVYFDNGATTPLKPEVLEAMTPYFCEVYGNPSSLHSAGAEAARAVQSARETVSKCINAEPAEIIFTGSGTEADNIAINGVLSALEKIQIARGVNGKGHIIISAIEHHGVLYIAKKLKAQGYEVSYIGVDKTGKVNPQEVVNAVKDNTLIISIMHANNEVGTIQPIAEIAEKLSKVNSGRAQRVYFHSDCVQSAGKIALDVKALGVDLVSIASHKFYGPKGVGVLYVKKGVPVAPILFGGAQERGLRPGTENVAGIVGFAKAFEIAVENLDKNAEYVSKLCASLCNGILSTVPETVVNGSLEKSVSGIVNIGFKCIEGEAILLKLSQAGVAVSTGSACATDSVEPSHVLSAMGVDTLAAAGAVRFSLGCQNTKEEVDYVLSILPKIVEDLRKMSPLWKS